MLDWVQEVPLQIDIYIVFFKIKTKTCKDGRKVKMESF